MADNDSRLPIRDIHVRATVPDDDDLTIRQTGINDTDDDTNIIYRIHAKQLLTMFFNYVYILVETEYFLEILDSLYIKAMNQNLVLLIS